MALTSFPSKLPAVKNEFLTSENNTLTYSVISSDAFCVSVLSNTFVLLNKPPFTVVSTVAYSFVKFVAASDKELRVPSTVIPKSFNRCVVFPPTIALRILSKFFPKINPAAIPIGPNSAVATVFARVGAIANTNG